MQMLLYSVPIIFIFFKFGKFLKAPYAIINGTRALTAYVDDVTTTSLTLNWFAAWGSGLGSEFGMVRILLVEPN